MAIVMFEMLKIYFNFTVLKEDIRKLGVNFVSSGIIGLSIINFSKMSFSLILGSLWLVIIGCIMLLYGSSNRGGHGYL